MTTRSTGKGRGGKPSKAMYGIPAASNHAAEWQRTPGTYLAGSEHVEEADAAAIEMERKWGRGRLRLLVDPDLREKFDRQRYLFGQALTMGGLEDVKREAARMAKAWRALDRAAEAAGAKILPATVWEVTLGDGSVAAIVREPELAQDVIADGRDVRVYTLEEIGELIYKFPEIATIKVHFPGAEVVPVKQYRGDPIDGIPDFSAPIDGVIGEKGDEDGF